MTGDVLVHAVQLANPDVAYRSEADQAVARETRRRLLADARTRGARLATAHLHTGFLPFCRRSVGTSNRSALPNTRGVRKVCAHVVSQAHTVDGLRADHKVCADLVATARLAPTCIPGLSASSPAGTRSGSRRRAPGRCRSRGSPS